MSSDESTSSDQERLDARDLAEQNCIGYLREEQSESTSQELVPMNTGGLTPFQDLSRGQFGQVALLSSSGPVGPVENTVAGGDFRDSNFGPVTNRNNVTLKRSASQIGTQNVVNNYFGSNIPDEPSTSGNQARQEGIQDIVKLSDCITLFKNQELHKTKLIYKGEKSTAGGKISLAVKLIKHSPKALREAKSLHSADFHPNVVRVYDSGSYNADMFVFIAMERCSTETLINYINQCDNFNLRLAAQHATQIISGLRYIHGKKISHRDLKPDNILFSLNGRYDQVKIIDFSVSKNYETDFLISSQANFTHGYAAPEIIERKKIEDPTKCDIFSLGILLVFILSHGKHPYGDQPWQWSYNIACGIEPNLSKIRLPNGNQRNVVLKIIRKMLQNNPRDRPSAEHVFNNWPSDCGDLTEETSESSEIPSTSQGFRVLTSEDHAFADEETQPKEVADTAENAVSRLRGKRLRTDDLARVDTTGNEENAPSGIEKKRPRLDVSASIYAPCIIGVTIDRYNRCDELVCWRSIEDLERGPTIISEMGEVPLFYYSIIAYMRSFYLLMKDKSFYAFDLDDVAKGLTTLDSMKHDHGLSPPAAILDGKLYACGKVIRRTEEPTKKCEVFFKKKWSDVADMNKARNGNCVVAFEGCFYAIGGVDAERNTLTSVERYHPSRDEWEFVEPLTVPRYNARAVVYNNKLYVLGGYGADGEWIASFEYFEPRTLTWTRITSAWLRKNVANFPVVFDNKVFTVLWNEFLGSRTIAQVPLDNEDEKDLVSVPLSNRWRVCRLLALGQPESLVSSVDSADASAE